AVSGEDGAKDVLSGGEVLGSLTGGLGVSVCGNVSMSGASCTTTGILEVEDGELSFDASSSWKGHDIRISGSGVIRVAGVKCSNPRAPSFGLARM
ncbi:MAG: hypothetical protein IJT34_07815, partial [Butyrivibrio sp.]|nr:hypothetical protein [Butyrivibrio sp.]